MTQQIYEDEFQQLIDRYGERKVLSVYSTGIESYIDSRKRGNYSFQSCEHTLKGSY